LKNEARSEIPELLVATLIMKRIKHKRSKSFYDVMPDGAVLSLLKQIRWKKS